MRCACIDIGSNTTRVLVADVAGGELREVVCEKAFTRLGSALRRTGCLPSEALAALAEVVAAQRAVATSLSALRVRVVATAAIRAAADPEALVAAIAERTGLFVDVLGTQEEARLAFAGATHARRAPVEGPVAVVDVGGGSTEIAVGPVGGGVQWSASLALGSSTLADDHLHSDPPSRSELDCVAREVAAAFSALDPPAVDVALAVGGSATSTARLVGPRIDAQTLGRALAILAATPSDAVVSTYGLDLERVRLLPAGLHLLGAAAARLGRPLEVGDGGVREGVCLELAASQ